MNCYGSIPSLNIVGKFTGCRAAGQFFANTLCGSASLKHPGDDSPAGIRNFMRFFAVLTTFA